MSGKPRPSQATEAEQLRELIGEARGLLKDLRAEMRAARETIADAKRIFGETLQAHYDDVQAALQGSADSLRDKLADRDRDFVTRAATSVPVRMSCAWCGTLLAAMMDLTTDELRHDCPECGEETVIQLVDASKRERFSQLIAGLDETMHRAEASGADLKSFFMTVAKDHPPWSSLK